MRKLSIVVLPLIMIACSQMQVNAQDPTGSATVSEVPTEPTMDPASQIPADHIAENQEITNSKVILQPTSSPGPDDEHVTEPGRILGSYMTCEEQDTAADFVVVVACRLADEAGAKLSVNPKDSVLSFDYSLGDAKNATVNPVLQDPASAFHVKYFFSSTGKKVVRRVASQAKFSAELSSRADAFAKKFYDFDVSDALRANPLVLPNVSPNPKFIRYPVSDANGNGACDVGEDCAYMDLRGIVWSSAAKDTDLNHDSARIHCENLVFASYGNWVLPNHDELVAASADGITQLKDLFPSGNSKFWSDAPLPSDGDKIEIIDFSTGVATASEISLKSGAICHHHLGAP